MKQPHIRRFPFAALRLCIVLAAVLLPGRAFAREATEWMTGYWYNASDNNLPRVLLQLSRKIFNAESLDKPIRKTHAPVPVKTPEVSSPALTVWTQNA